VTLFYVPSFGKIAYLIRHPEQTEVHKIQLCDTCCFEAVSSINIIDWLDITDIMLTCPFSKSHSILWVMRNFSKHFQHVYRCEFGLLVPKDF